MNISLQNRVEKNKRCSLDMKDKIRLFHGTPLHFKKKFKFVRQRKGVPREPERTHHPLTCAMNPSRSMETMRNQACCHSGAISFLHPKRLLWAPVAFALLVRSGCNARLRTASALLYTDWPTNAVSGPSTVQQQPCTANQSALCN